MQLAIFLVLVVIASVLLFGREDTLSVLQPVGTVALVLALGAIALALVYWVLKEIGKGLNWAADGVLNPILSTRWYSVAKVRYPRAVQTILVFALTLGVIPLVYLIVVLMAT